MDYPRFDLDLPGQEDKLRAAERRLTDILQRLDERVFSIEQRLTPREETLELGEYGAVDASVTYSTGLGVEIKARGGTLLYELRYRRTDVPDPWHYIVQATNDFVLPVEDPEALEVQIRYLPDAFSKWTPWKSITLSPQPPPASGLEAQEGDVTVEVEGLSVRVKVRLPENPVYPKIGAQMGLFVKIAEYQGGNEPTSDDAKVWGVVPWPQDEFIIDNLKPHTTYYLFIRLGLYYYVGGALEYVYTIKDYGSVSFTSGIGEAVISVTPTPSGEVLVVHNMGSTTGWNVTGGQVTTTTDRVEGGLALAFKPSTGGGVVTATYTFGSNLDNTGKPIFSWWYKCDGSDEQLSYIRFQFLDASDSVIFQHTENNPIGVGSWRRYMVELGESSAIRKLVITMDWRLSLTNWVKLDYLTFESPYLTPKIDIIAGSGIIRVYPLSGLPSLWAHLIPIETEHYYWTSNVTLTVPAGQIYFVQTAKLIADTNSLTIGGTYTYQTFSGINDFVIRQIAGPGQRIQFTTGGSGNARVLITKYEIPPFMKFYNDFACTTSNPFPPSLTMMGIIWDWAFAGGANAIRDSVDNVNIALHGKRNIDQPWLHMGQTQFIPNTGTVYISALMAETEVTT